MDEGKPNNDHKLVKTTNQYHNTVIILTLKFASSKINIMADYSAYMNS